MSQVTKITIGRLFNLGNYEHKRYEIEVTIEPGHSAAEALEGVERILAALRPKCPIDISELHECRRRAKWEAKDWLNYLGRGNRDPEHCEKDNLEALAKLEATYKKWKEHEDRMRSLLDNLGAASQYKDAKQDWEDPEF